MLLLCPKCGKEFQANERPFQTCPHCGTGFTNIVKKHCARCGKEFEGTRGTPDYCKECFPVFRQIHLKVAELLRGEIALDKIDESLAKRINALISNENPATAVHDGYILQSAINRVLREEAQRIRLFEELRRLQRRL